MTDLKQAMERAVSKYSTSAGALVATYARAARRRRARRVTTIALAAIVSVFGISLVVVAFGSSVAHRGRSVGVTGSSAPPTPTTAVVTKIGTMGSVGSGTYADGSVWISDTTSGSQLVQVSSDTGQVLGRTTLPDVPYVTFGGGGLASTNGQVWVCGTVEGTAAIEIVDGQTGALLDVRKLNERRAVDVAFSGSEAFVLGEDADGHPVVVAMEVLSGTVDWSTPLPQLTNPMRIFATGDAVFVDALTPDAERTLVRLGQESGNLQGELSSANLSEFAVSDTGSIWALSAGGVAQIDPTAMTVARQLPLTGTPVGGTLAADSSGIWIVVTGISVSSGP